MSPLTLTDGGKPLAQIHVAKDAAEPERYAAELLQKYVELVSGARLPITAESLGKRPAVLVGRSPAAERAAGRFDWSALREDGILIRTTGDRLVLAGCTGRGTLYAVFEFLERACACRWPAPGGPHVPSRSRITSAGADAVHTPPFRYREPYYHLAADPEWALANRANGMIPKLGEREGGKWVYARYFVHNFYHLVPPARYFAAHPEYYSEIDGRRIAVQAQLCLTNPDVLRIATDECRRLLREWPAARIMTISQEDCGNYCTCATCKEVDEAEGSPSGTLIAFVNAVAERLEGEFPEVLFDTLAYTHSVQPPRNVRPRRNVVVRLCNMGACDCHPLGGCPCNDNFVSLVDGWGRIAPELFVWTYANNFHHYFQPYPNLDAIISDVPFYASHGVTGLMFQGDAGPTRGSGDMCELHAYLTARLMWDPRRDGRQVIEEFLQIYYGKAAEPVRDYLEHLHTPLRGNMQQHFRLYEPLMHPLFTPQWIARANALFDEAERRAADDDAVLERVRTARLPVDYMTWKPALRYGVRGRRFVPLDEGHAALARRFYARARAHGAEGTREGGRLIAEEEGFLADHDLVTLGAPGLEILVGPDLGGRIGSLRDGAGAEWLHQPVPADMDHPVAGGYEEYSDMGWRSPGWCEQYECERSGDSLRLHADLGNGLRLARIYSIDASAGGARLAIESTLTNLTGETRACLIRLHPVLDPGRWEEAALRVRNADGTWREMAPWRDAPGRSGDQWFEGEACPAGQWMLRRGDRGLVIAFDSVAVWKCLLDWNRALGTVNLEVFGARRELPPGGSLSLRQEWRVVSLADERGGA